MPFFLLVEKVLQWSDRGFDFVDDGLGTAQDDAVGSSLEENRPFFCFDFPCQRVFGKIFLSMFRLILGFLLLVGDVQEGAGAHGVGIVNAGVDVAGAQKAVH